MMMAITLTDAFALFSMRNPPRDIGEGRAVMARELRNAIHDIGISSQKFVTIVRYMWLRIYKRRI